MIGIVKGTDDVRSLTSKQGKELKKRDIHLVDESHVQIRLTLWANDVSHASVCLSHFCSLTVYSRPTLMTGNVRELDSCRGMSGNQPEVGETS